jgi:hypothetical protein
LRAFPFFPGSRLGGGLSCSPFSTISENGDAKALIFFFRKTEPFFFFFFFSPFDLPISRLKRCFQLRSPKRNPELLEKKRVYDAFDFCTAFDGE